MLKKIIAAAAASTLAVSALAATASAAPAQVTFEGWNVPDYVTVKVEGTVEDFGKCFWVSDVYKDSKNQYSSFEVKVTNKFGDDLKITGGKVSATLAANYESSQLKKVDDSTGKAPTDTGWVPTYEQEWKAPDDGKSRNASVTGFDISETTLAKDKDTKGTVKATFDLADVENGGRRLIGDGFTAWDTDATKSKLTVELTMVLTPDEFNALCGAGKIKNAKTDAKLDKDWVADVNDGKVTATAGLLDVKLTPKDVDPGFSLGVSWKVKSAELTTKKYIPFDMIGEGYAYAISDYAADWSRADLRAFVNGGKMEFVFSQNVGGKDWVDGAVTFTNSNLQNTTVKTDYTEKSNTVSVEIPVNFTYSANTNEYPAPVFAWEIEKKPGDGLKDMTISKIVFTANDAAPGNNGGLVEDDNNKPANSDNNSTATPSTPSNDNVNSGSNTSDEKNPSTGVAMAVAPVALAAAAAAVVISKKRK